MGKARKAHAAGDLWHLSIDDLLMPPGESPEPAGSGPFVINLSTSTAPIPAPPARMPRFEGLRLYQIQLAHDEGEHRVQFRLRLGVIQSALEADAILATVREHYPGATLDSATDEDETAVAEATVTQPMVESAAAGIEAAAPSAVAAESKRPNAALPASANASAAKAPPSLLPDVPLEPMQEIRWDIDDLLPDLPVTRPSQPKRAANERSEGAANARGRKGHSPATPPPASRSSAAQPPTDSSRSSTPARRNPHRAPARKAPAAPLPPAASSPTPPISTAVPERARAGVPAAAAAEIETVNVEIQSPASLTPAAAPFSEVSPAPAMPMASPLAEAELPVIAAATPEVSAPEAAAPADEILASLPSLPADEVSASHAPAPADTPAAMVLEALPSEVPTLAAAEPVLLSAAPEPKATDAEEDFNFDFDSNANTVEVEALVMIDATGESLDPERGASALEPVVSEAPLAPAVASNADVIFELEYLDPTVLDVPAPEAASDSELTQEVFFEIDPPPSADRVASADSVTVEAPALWRDASQAAGIASAQNELSPDSVTVEALALDIRTPAGTESPWTLNEADADSDAQAMEALAAKISAQSGADLVAAAAVEPVSPEPEPTADSLTPEAAALNVGALHIVASPLDSPELPSQAESAVPEPEAEALAPEAPLESDPLSDSQTLEEVVAKLDARSAEATLAAAPVRKEDSQTLEVLVAKIGALVESAEARDHSESALRAEPVLAETAPSSHEPTADVEPARRIDMSVAAVTLALVESDAADQPAPLAALAEPLVHVEPLEVVEWEPVHISDTPAAAETLEAQVASAPTAAPVEPPAPAPTTDESSLTSTTAKIRVRSPALPASAPAQWPIAPTAKATPRASPATLRSSLPEPAKPSQPQRGHSVPTRSLESRATPPAAPPPPEPIAEVAPDAETPAFDSTQTIRALTPLELQNGQASKSFAIQLLLSEEPIHPEQIPNLDIFEAYRLYVVTGFFEERVMHALRLGFFTSEVAAEAVAGYLKGYFDVPSIKRVSLAEHDRFQERRVAARKDVGATGRHAAIELTSRPDLPERRAKVQETTAGKPDAPSSIWSRLVSPLKR